MIEEYSGFLHGKLSYETFFRHGDDIVEVAHFATEGPIYLHERRFEDGLMRSATTGRAARLGARIVRIHRRADQQHRDRAQRQPHAVLTAEHDDRGLLRLVQVTGSKSRVLYVRPPAGFDVDAACRAIEDMLVALIPDATVRLDVGDRIACLALRYARPTQLSIGISVATEAERADLSAIDAQAAWAPADFETSTDIDLDDTGPSRLVRQELAQLDADDYDVAAGSEIGRRLLCAVAARLNLHDWSATLPVTDDFVV
ncbi:hypothetical protein ACQP2C_26355 [Micromonospora zamorensis]|uniref:hypothetical protein n=1 Tax=Micromonospora zamorensis TaxID=709883 RepID=UPI003D99572F